MASFKKWLQEVYLNPLFYDMTTPEGRAEYERDKQEAEEMVAQRKGVREISRQPVTKQIALECWRGCTLQSLEMMTSLKTRDYRILDASRSRSKAIWFAHQYQAGGKDYAQNHGEVQMSLSLPCTSYSDIVQYSNGEKRQEPGKTASEKVQVYSESPFGIFGNQVIELPKGWTFSEHGEKHAICLTTVKIPNSAIQITHSSHETPLAS